MSDAMDEIERQESQRRSEDFLKRLMERMPPGTEIHEQVGPDDVIIHRVGNNGEEEARMTNDDAERRVLRTLVLPKQDDAGSLEVMAAMACEIAETIGVKPEYAHAAMILWLAHWARDSAKDGARIVIMNKHGKERAYEPLFQMMTRLSAQEPEYDDEASA